MVRPYLPLNALRAFEASARHLSFTRAAIELRVTQAAVSHQVKLLEERLKTPLFKRLPRGLMITEEGQALLPVLKDSFDRMADVVERFENGHLQEVLTIGAVGTFAVGWLLPRLGDFRDRFPTIDIRLSTNNNRTDIAAEGLDYAIRFGDGAWHGTEAYPLFEAPLSPLCIPQIARNLHTPIAVTDYPMLRSYRGDEWSGWFDAAGVSPPHAGTKGIVFDSSLAMMEAAVQGMGIALAPPSMFSRLLLNGSIEQPFRIYTSRGKYWLTRLKSRTPTPAMKTFKNWLLGPAMTRF
ncbi:LysR family transcriptional regulator [Rhizobium sp. KVB221]|uniref:LysR family transcriptional regulator n=1 Tax=Rhizobium setariae TaxID=2801340 RepID=A0A936YPK9_9HYPH|nr:LysR family transcriptional regulator [Rhizobium setariae]MBL0370441.1 LysR family transcriptional regulator [Rhizobium setariae]